MGANVVGDIGEFALIDRIVARLDITARPAVLLGPGDDAAILVVSDNRVVASTDALVEGRHFRRDWSTGLDVGRRAAAQGIADISAMGADPTGVLVVIACPADLGLDWVDGFADGLRQETARAGAVVVGGDVVRSETLMITVTALGDLRGRAPVTRAGARPGDVVAVAGRLGWSAAGLAVLGRGFRSPAVVVAAYRYPEPPYEQGPIAAELGATAMCDVSDGLLADLGHIADASGVRIELTTASFAIADRLRDVGSALGVDPLVWVLEGGEDHALAAAFPADVPLPAQWSVIGSVAEGEGLLVDGEPRPPAGFDHFASGG